MSIRLHACRRARRLFAAATVLSLAAACVHARPAANQTACWFDNASANPAVCGWLKPSLQDSSKRTALPYAILRELPDRASGHAVIYLNGGPGGGSELNEEGMRNWRMWRANLGLHVDLIVYDQRGTGIAKPTLACDSLDKAMRHAMTADAPYATRAAAVEQALLGCARDVPLADRQSGLYSTATAVQDLRDLMDALQRTQGYRSFALYGASYGTRLAIETLRHPEVPVDRVVLDSVYPPGSNSLDMLPEHVDAFIDAADAHCRQSTFCDDERGIRSGLRAAMDRLAKGPVRVDVRDPRATGDRIDMILDPTQLLALFVTSLYAGDWLPMLPETLNDLSKGKVDQTGRTLLNGAAWMWMELDLNQVTHRLIGCRDNQPVSRRKFEKQFNRYAEFKDVLLPLAETFDFCQAAGIEPAPLSTDWIVQVPALVLNMAIDPATPASRVETLVDRFPNGELRIVPGIGHGVVDRDRTWAERAGTFLNGGK